MSNKSLIIIYHELALAGNRMAFRNLYENREGTEPINSMWVEDKRKLCIILDARDHWKDLGRIVCDMDLTN